MASLLCCVLPVVAAFESDAPGPRSAGIGGAGISLFGDPWASARNPALGAIETVGGGVSWSQQFGLPELSREAVVAGWRLKHLSMGVKGTSFGSDLYRESEFGLSIAKLVDSTFAVGLEVSARSLQIRGYSTGGAFALAAGLWVHPLPRASFGAVWRNLNDPPITGYSERISESLVIGTAIHVSEDDNVVFDVLQEPHFPAEYRIGAEGRVMSPLWLRVGMRLEPARPSAGFEFQTGQWRVLYGVDLHPDLGPSHEIGLAITVR